MENEAKKCYVCLEIPKDPVYPAGCDHALCKNHLTVKFKN